MNSKYQKKNQISGAEAILECLVAEQVKTLFGYPGGANMPLYDAMMDYEEKIEHVLVRHDQAAIHAAEGYAQVSGTVGVCMATSGPGATNLVTGLADAMMDSQPVVAITGQVAQGLIGTDAFQEVDIMGITAPVTKWSYQITEFDEIGEVMAKAFYLARSGRPGPVLVDMTKDVQFALGVLRRPKRVQMPSYQPNYEPHARVIAKAIRCLNEAKRPLILAGHGVSIAGAQKELRKLAEKAGVPVAVTLWGLSNMPVDSEYYVGLLGMHGNYGPNKLSNTADVVLAVGMRFDDRVTGKLEGYLAESQVIHIDIDPAEINKNVKATIPIVADAKLALKALAAGVAEKEYPEWLAEFAACQAEEFAAVITPGLAEKATLPSMMQVIHELSDLTKGEAYVVSDVGQHQMITMRYYAFANSNHWVTSGGLGTMGFGMPAAMGVQAAVGNDLVISVSGDGGFQMNIQELATIRQEGWPLKILILNNGYLGMVRQWQELFFDKRYASTRISSPDFVEIAAAYGIPGQSVNRLDEVREAMEDWLAESGPALLEIKVKAEENVFPMVPSGQRVEEIRLQ